MSPSPAARKTRNPLRPPTPDPTPNETPTTYGFTGKVQKGPFVTGTEINLYELNEKLAQTGKAFRTTITANDGSFSLSDMELTSQYAMLSANGFFFSEIYGASSPAQLNLQAVADLADKEHLNINAMTHVVAPRIIKLVGEGKTFASAKGQAEKEWLEFLGVEEDVAGFDQMDIAASEAYNGILLSFSLMLQNYTSNIGEQSLYVAWLTSLLADITADFAEDGVVENEGLISQLLENAASIDRAVVRANMTNYYSQMGQQVNIPDFERYIALFQEKYDPNLITDFCYPEMASPTPIEFPDDMLPNLLVKDATALSLAETFVAAAAVPLGKTLKIKVYTDSEFVGASQPNYGWTISHENGAWVLDSRIENEVMACVFYLDAMGMNHHGEATVEYYEDSDTPTFTKHVTW